MILLAVLLFVSSCLPFDMASGQAEYSPTSTINQQAGQQAPGKSVHGIIQKAYSHGGMTPAQPGESLLEDAYSVLHPAVEPGLPSLDATAFQADRCLIYTRPLSELATRTGGHAPP